MLSATPGDVTLEAPLEPNLNHRATAFGGSVAALAILAGWTLVHERLHDEGMEGASTVIQTSEMRYVAPVHGSFQARCEAPDAASWDRFLRTLRRWSKARVSVSVEVTCGGALVGTFRGAYVTLDEGQRL